MKLDKSAIAMVTARFVRKAAGRITKREAAKLAKLYAVDIYWKYLGKDGDKLAMRAPGEFAKTFMSAKYLDDIGIAFKRERRSPMRGGSRGTETENRLARIFAWYGPNSGMWPGDKLVLGTGYFGRAAWVVEHASDCPCAEHHKAA